MIEEGVNIRKQRLTVPEHAHCWSCKLLKPISEFYKNRNKASGVSFQCKDCIKIEKKEYYRRVGYKKNTRYITIKEEIILEFGGGCCRCGYNEFMSALEFHHVDPSGKEYNPGDIIRKGNRERVFAEIDKCTLLCSNCHSSFEAGEWVGEFIKRDGLGYSLNLESPDHLT